MKPAKLLVVAAGLVFVLWAGGQHGYAVLAVVLGVVAYLVDISIYDIGPCGACDRGKRRSWLTGNERLCGKCGGTNVRKPLGRRLFDRGS